MTSQYQRTAASAKKQIDGKGRPVTVVFSTNGAYDAQTDTPSGDAATEEQTRGVFTNYTSRDIDGELIRLDDKKLLLAAASLSKAPKTGDTIKDGADEYAVIRTETVQPGDLPLLYKVQVRA